MKRILIADHLHPVFKAEAEGLGYHCDDRPEISREETLSIIGDYEVIAIRTKFRIDRELMDAGTKLKIIARAGAGMDNIDEDYAMSRGIICINAPEGNRDAVAEHAIGMLLSLANNLNKGDSEIRQGIWDREGNRGWEIKGKTIGIIGYGNTGQSFARKLSGFEVTILAYDKYHPEKIGPEVRSVSLNELQLKADVLSFHIPLSSETRHFFDDKFLEGFHKQIILLNTSRGEVVDSSAVLRGLNKGLIIAAGLDVLEVEKFPGLKEQEWYEGLISSKKVLLSPHVAGWTVESYRKISEVLAGKLALLLRAAV